MKSYSRNELKSALSAVGVTTGSVCLVHTSLWSIGQLDDPDDLPQAWLEVLQEQVGASGALILPAFSYSYCKHKLFDPHKSLGCVSMLANYAILYKMGYRSPDPNFSYVFIPGSEQVAAKIAAYTFSNVSFSMDHSMVGLAFELSDEPLLLSVRTEQEPNPFTCRHYVEQAVQRRTRFMIKFSGQSLLHGEVKNTDSYYFCRIMVTNTEPANDEIIPLNVPLGEGGIYRNSLRGEMDTFREQICADPWYSLKGPVLSDAELEALRAQDQVCPMSDLVPVCEHAIKL